MEVFNVRPKVGPDSTKKNLKNAFLKNMAHWTIIPRTSNFNETMVLPLEKFASDIASRHTWLKFRMMMMCLYLYDKVYASCTLKF